MDMTVPNTVQVKQANNLKQYQGVAARILKLLGTGITQRQAAETVGCNESYVSQLCAEQDFMVQLAQLMQHDIERAQEIDESYEETEKVLAKRLKDLVSVGVTAMSPDAIVRLLKFVNDAKRKTQVGKPLEGAGAGTSTTNVLKLILPQVIINQYNVNPNNEIVSVGEQELVTLNSQSMGTLMQAKRVRALLAPVPKPDKELKAVYGKSTDPWSNL